MKNIPIGQILVENGFLKEDQLEEALEKQRSEPGKKSILSLQQQIANARQAIAELEVGKLQYEQELAIHNGEIADTRRKIELFENDLADYDAEIENTENE